jgi:hypothetical protein
VRNYIRLSNKDLKGGYAAAVLLATEAPPRELCKKRRHNPENDGQTDLLVDALYEHLEALTFPRRNARQRVKFSVTSIREQRCPDGERPQYLGVNFKASAPSVRRSFCAEILGASQVV